MVQNTIDRNRYFEINDKLWEIGRNWLCALKQYACKININSLTSIFYLLTHVSFSLYKEGEKKKKRRIDT